MEDSFGLECPFIMWNDPQVSGKSWNALFTFNKEHIEQLLQRVVHNTNFVRRTSAKTASLLLETLRDVANKDRPQHAIPFPNGSSGQTAISTQDGPMRLENLCCEQLNVEDKERGITVTTI